MKDTRSNDFKVGIFVTLGVAFSMVTILILGGAENAFTRKITYKTHLPGANGIVAGSKVVLSGIPVGTVHGVEYQPEAKVVEVEIAVMRKYAEYVTVGSTVEVMTQGVLGDKFLGINRRGRGHPESAVERRLGFPFENRRGHGESEFHDRQLEPNSPFARARKPDRLDRGKFIVSVEGTRRVRELEEYGEILEVACRDSR
jgi:hypothetical protein